RPFSFRALRDGLHTRSANGCAVRHFHGGGESGTTHSAARHATSGGKKNGTNGTGFRGERDASALRDRSRERTDVVSPRSNSAVRGSGGPHSPRAAAPEP